MMQGVTKLLPAHNPYARPKTPAQAKAAKSEAGSEDGRLSPAAAETRRRRALDRVAKANRRKEYTSLKEMELQKRAEAVIPADVSPRSCCLILVSATPVRMAHVGGGKGSAAGIGAEAVAARPGAGRGERGD